MQSRSMFFKKENIMTMYFADKYTLGTQHS